MNLYFDTWSVWHLKTWFVMVHISIYSKHQGSYPTPNTQRWKEGRQWSQGRFGQCKGLNKSSEWDEWYVITIDNMFMPHFRSKIELLHIVTPDTWSFQESRRWGESRRREEVEPQGNSFCQEPQQLRTAQSDIEKKKRKYILCHKKVTKLKFQVHHSLTFRRWPTQMQRERETATRALVGCPPYLNCQFEFLFLYSRKTQTTQTPPHNNFARGITAWDKSHFPRPLDIVGVASRVSWQNLV